MISGLMPFLFFLLCGCCEAFSTTSLLTPPSRKQQQQQPQQQLLRRSPTLLVVNHHHHQRRHLHTTTKTTRSTALLLSNDNNNDDDYDQQNQKILSSLRLVVISDTHGMEDQLPLPLPAGDVLIHLGDYASDGPKRKVQRSLLQFEQWLSNLPFQYKLIIRGNHDPRIWQPPQQLDDGKDDSGTTTSTTVYACTTRPKTVTIPWPTNTKAGTNNPFLLDNNGEQDEEQNMEEEGVTFHLIPHMSSGARRVGLKTNSLLKPHQPKKGKDKQKKHHRHQENNKDDNSEDEQQIHVLCTHPPPHGILDKTYEGKHVGSTALKKAIKQHDTLPPQLWLFGHIHEGRGIDYQQFTLEEEESNSSNDRVFSSNTATSTTTTTTTLINAANANPGRAQKLVHGPIVVQLNLVEVSSNDDDANALSSSPLLLQSKEEDEKPATSTTRIQVEVLSMGDRLEEEQLKPRPDGLTDKTMNGSSSSNDNNNNNINGWQNKNWNKNINDQFVEERLQQQKEREEGEVAVNGASRRRRRPQKSLSKRPVLELLSNAFYEEVVAD